MPWQPRSTRCQALRDVRLSGKYLLPNYSHYRRRAIANVLFREEEGGGGAAGMRTGPAHTRKPRLPPRLIKVSGNASCRRPLKILLCN